MSNKSDREKGSESQKERFERTAREHGVELDEKKLAETLRRMAKREKPEKRDDKDE